MKRILIILAFAQICRAQVVVPFILSSAAAAAITYTIDYSPALLNGGFESLDGANNFSNWTESGSGTSTVTDDGTIKHSGSHSVRITIDAGKDNTYILQNISGLTGKTVHWSFWAIASAAGGFLLPSSDNNSGQPDEFEIATTWTLYTGSFTGNDDYFEINNGYGSQSKYFNIDDLRLWITP
jgi:hypothetical protein